MATINGTAGDDSILGTSNNDILSGFEGNDTLIGSSGDDIIDGGVGDDSLRGGRGNDLFLFEDNHGVDIIADFDSFRDVIDFSLITTGIQSFEDILSRASQTSGGVTIETSPGNLILIPSFLIGGLRESNFVFSLVTSEGNEGGTSGDDVVEGGPGNNTLSGLAGNDILRGEEGNDTIQGGSGTDFISAGEGDDIATGGTGNDQIFAGPNDRGDDVFIGGAGNDTLGGGEGDDLLIGGGTNILVDVDGENISDDGFDIIFGGAGNDTLIGSGYDDRNGDGQISAIEASFSVDRAEELRTDANILYAGSGDDQIYGASGNDTLGGGTGNDILNGFAGNDLIYGGRGDDGRPLRNDQISGGEGDDTVFAGGGNDDISGGEGDDLLFNGSGFDIIDGGEGNDTIFGGAGSDTITGGEGRDEFVFVDGNGNDRITDFNISEDILDLSETEFDFANLSDLQSRATNTLRGNFMGVLIQTGDGDSIFIERLSVDDLAQVNVVF